MMTMKRWMLVLCCLGLIAPGVAAQDNPQDQRKLVVRAFELKYVDPHQMVDLMGELSIHGDSWRAVADATTGRLVVRGPQAQLDVVATMVQELDVKPVTRQVQTTETVILKPRERSVISLSDPLRLVLGHKGKMAVDQARNVIVVRDTPDSISRAQGVLRDLDIAQTSYSLEFLVLGHGGNSLDTLGEARKVVRELEGLGLQGYGVLGRMAVRSVEGQQFGTYGSFDDGSLSVEGKVRSTSGSAVEVALSTEISRIGSGKSDPQRGRGNVDRATVQTTLRVPLGHLIIVGLAPAGGAASQPMVLAMTARADDA